MAEEKPEPKWRRGKTPEQIDRYLLKQREYNKGRQAKIEAARADDGEKTVLLKTVKDLVTPVLTQRKSLRRFLDELMDMVGLTPLEIARAHRRLLKATKYVTVGGEQKRVPDYPSIQKAVRDAYNLRGYFEAEPVKANYGCVIVHLTPEKREIIEAMRGSPLPISRTDPIDITPEEVDDGDDAPDAA